MADYYFNPETADWAPDLEVNSIKSKIEKHRLMRLQKQAENSLITQDFKSGFPEYHQILANYSKSRIFANKYQTVQDKQVSDLIEESQIQLDRDFMSDGTTTQGDKMLSMGSALPRGYQVRG